MYSIPVSESSSYTTYIFIIFIIVVIIGLLIFLYYYKFKSTEKPKGLSQEEIQNKCDKLMEDHITITPEQDVLWYYENCNGNNGERCKNYAIKGKTTNLTRTEMDWFNSKCERPLP